MTEAEEKALRLLATFERKLVRPGFFGSCLWPDTNRPTWAFARPAGKLLNRLRTLGFAEWLTIGPNRREEWGWAITPAGTAALKAMPKRTTGKS